MSDPLQERLSQFTPDPGRFDRDGLLFAAGRASARPNRKWIALVGALAASQVATLLFLWPGSPAVLPSHDAPMAVETSPFPSLPMEKSALWALNQQFQAGRDDLPPPTPNDSTFVAGGTTRPFGVASNWLP